MKISTNSWHYRLLTKGVFGGLFSWPKHHLPETLCGYFWLVVLSLALTSITAFLSSTILGVVVFAPLATLVASVVTDYWVFDEIYAIPMVIGLTALGMGIAYLVYWAIARVLNSLETEGKESEPSLVGNMWQAHKDKVCPMLEYEDE